MEQFPGCGSRREDVHGAGGLLTQGDRDGSLGRLMQSHFMGRGPGKVESAGDLQRVPPESLAKYKLYRHGGKCCEAGGNTAREGAITAELNGSPNSEA